MPIAQIVEHDGLKLPDYLFGHKKHQRSTPPTAVFDPVTALAGGAAFASATAPSQQLTLKRIIIDQSSNFFHRLDNGKKIALLKRLKLAGFSVYFKLRDCVQYFYEVEDDLDAALTMVKDDWDKLGVFDPEKDLEVIAKEQGVAAGDICHLSRDRDLSKYLSSSQDMMVDDAYNFIYFDPSLDDDEHPFVDSFKANEPFIREEKVDSFIEAVLQGFEDLAKEIMALDEENFIHQLQKKMEGELGEVKIVSDKFSYPLILIEAQKFYHKKMLLIGDAACGVHPIAGQGFNLAIAGIVILQEIINRNLKCGLSFSSGAVIEEYHKKTKSGARKMLIATDILNSLFENKSFTISLMRDIGLGLVSKIPKLKTFFIKSAGGF